ncbi:hypothetical protein DICPUDRAFT_82771 [Dictyostelium purpureum]|uniref:Uncharacterized protein n=1 Tax=Dictyostelium purpureum TaxID=5786 RepID=F0ZXJ4_DICPU|nr:uncharacterized protein DICPUDRAFT_82771 [Dictyostelium purpureum]EGC31336.1 hypothetical protein DICPUDRAFT_82771 [Dictyostelium purpureum]|eukprot:XP_003292145.1 hypothetical protein DICPUDRAFT_82771 [Dictyostelium purpureum]
MIHQNQNQFHDQNNYNSNVNSNMNYNMNHNSYNNINGSNNNYMNNKINHNNNNTNCQNNFQQPQQHQYNNNQFRNNSYQTKPTNNILNKNNKTTKESYPILLFFSSFILICKFLSIIFPWSNSPIFITRSQFQSLLIMVIIGIILIILYMVGLSLLYFKLLRVSRLFVLVNLVLLVAITILDLVTIIHSGYHEFDYYYLYIYYSKISAGSLFYFVGGSLNILLFILTFMKFKIHTPLKVLQNKLNKNISFFILLVFSIIILILKIFSSKAKWAHILQSWNSVKFESSPSGATLALIIFSAVLTFVYIIGISLSFFKKLNKSFPITSVLALLIGSLVVDIAILISSFTLELYQRFGTYPYGERIWYTLACVGLDEGECFLYSGAFSFFVGMGLNIALIALSEGLFEDCFSYYNKYKPIKMDTKNVAVKVPLSDSEKQYLQQLNIYIQQLNSYKGNNNYDEQKNIYLQETIDGLQNYINQLKTHHKPIDNNNIIDSEVLTENPVSGDLKSPLLIKEAQDPFVPSYDEDQSLN